MHKIPLRSEFLGFPSRIDWFPGHMRKAMRLVETHHLKKIDVFIEVRDARIPKTS
jgi:ribosome biogenesis GTPase A